MKIKECRSCGKANLTNILNLGSQPWCNNFIEKKHLKKKEKKYPLKLVQCENCELLQLDFTVPKEVMFLKHDYLSSTTSTLSNFFLNLAKENKKQFKLKKKDLILDIGGNDGTQMIQYQNIGLTNTINVESAKIYQKFQKKWNLNF